MGGRVLPLGLLQADCDAVVKDLNGGQCLRQRLADMGLIRGAKVRIIKNEMGGPVIISIGDGRLALGRGMALKIMVEEAG
jgi:ferrous iron transport protein A